MVVKPRNPKPKGTLRWKSMCLTPCACPPQPGLLTLLVAILFFPVLPLNCLGSELDSFSQNDKELTSLS